MPRKAVIALLLFASFTSPVSHAQTEERNAGRQSYESCGLITSEYVTVLQLISRGFDPETLKQSLPEISSEAAKRIDALFTMAQNEGLIDSYSTINSEYANCAKQVYDATGLPPRGSREAAFHACAGENKVGYEITIAALVGAEESDILEQLDSRHRDRARTIFQAFESGGRLSIFDTLATELKRCIASAS